MGLLKTAAGVVVTVVIGGTAYTVSQQDVVDNFAEDTGVSQQQAQEYVDGVKQEDLIPYEELGVDYVKQGNEVILGINEIDCVSYEYEWQSPTLSCEQGKNQLTKYGNDIIALGNSYKRLGSTTAGISDIPPVISSIDTLNLDYEMETLRNMYTSSEISEAKKANSYNKANLKAVLDSN